MKLENQLLIIRYFLSVIKLIHGLFLKKKMFLAL